ncbi:MAG: T9SS type A sorting domain-containing protein [Bacteroidales bacterium]
MLRTFTFLLITILLCGGSLSSKATTATIAHHNEYPGQVLIPVTVSGFTNVTTITMSFSYDSTVLVYTGYQNFALSGSLVVASSPVGGNNLKIVTISWIGNKQTVNGTLIDIEFDYTGAHSDLNFTFVEVTNQSFNPISVTTCDGSISPPVEIILGELNNQLPGPVLIPLDVDFSMVYAGVPIFQFLVEYDSDILVFNEVENSYFSEIQYSTPSVGQILISWIGSATQYNGKLLDLNFTYKSGYSPVSFKKASCFVKKSINNNLPVVYADGYIDGPEISLSLSTLVSDPEILNICSYSLITLQLKDGTGVNFPVCVDNIFIESDFGVLSEFTAHDNGLYTALLSPEVPYNEGYTIIKARYYDKYFDQEAEVPFLPEPVIIFPENIQAFNDEGYCGAEIDISIPFTGSPTPVFTFTVEDSIIEFPYFFPVGTSLVLVEADYECGMASSSFTVQIIDNEAPQAPSDVNYIVNCVSEAVQPEALFAPDNCDGQVQGILLYVIDEPDPIICSGIRTFVFSYTDTANNTSSSTYSYTIIPPEPEIIFPDNIQAFNDEGYCGAEIDISIPFTGSPTPVFTFTVEDSIIEFPYFFPVGTSTVLVEADYECGMASSSFTVQIIDNEAPQAPSSVNYIVNCVSEAVQPEALFAPDNCDGQVQGILLYVIDEPDPIVCAGQRTFVFSYNDTANNTSSSTYSYTILPTTGPELINPQEDCSSLNLSELKWNLTQAEEFDANSLTDDVAALYTDNCNGSVVVVFTETIPGENNSDESWIMNYEITITDICGNSIICYVTYSGGIQSEVPEDIDLPEWVVETGDDLCFGATETIVIQHGLTVTGGSINLIAGKSIRLLPDVDVQSGAYLHAYISDTYCENPTPLVVAKEISDEQFSESEHSAPINDLFVVFPNPTSGAFVVKLNRVDVNSNIEIFSLTGQRILKQEVKETTMRFDLKDHPNGIYIIRVINGTATGTGRIVKQ